MGNPSNFKHHIITKIHNGLVLSSRGKYKQNWLNKLGQTNLAKQTWPNKLGKTNLVKQTWSNKLGLLTKRQTIDREIDGKSIKLQPSYQNKNSQRFRSTKKG